MFGFPVILSGSAWTFDYAHPIRTTTPSITEGTSNTVLMSEIILSATDDAHDTRGDFLNDDMNYVGWGFSSINPPNSPVADVLPTCGGQTPLSPCIVGSSHYQSARSFHIGGVNSVFADGSVRFIPNTISQTVWAEYATKDGGEYDPGDSGSSTGSSGLADGSFATPPLTANSFQVDPTGSPWTFKGYAYLQNSSGAWNFPAGFGQTGVIQNYQGSAGSVSQSFQLSSGSHTVSFQYVGRPGSGDVSVTVALDGNTVGVAPPPGSGTWQSYTTPSFTVSTSGSYTLTLTATSPTQTDSSDAITGVMVN
jgi:prepilin-type processing-associated H-X9-DG protein